MVTSEKDLGIIFKDDLSFDEHIAAKVKKATSLIDSEIFHTSRHKYVSDIVYRNNSTAFVIWRSHMESTFKKLITMIENVQRRASKMIPGLSHLSYQHRLEALKLPTLQYRRYRGDMIEMFKLPHGYYDEMAIKDFIEFG